MKTQKLILLVVGFLIPVVSDAQSVGITTIDQALEAFASNNSQSYYNNSIAFQPFQQTAQADYASLLYTAHAFATLDSNISLSSYALSIQSKGSMDTSISAPTVGNAVVGAQADTIVVFSISSPFTYSVQTALTQSQGSPIPQAHSDDRTFVSLSTFGSSDHIFLFGDANGSGSGPFSGSSSGILQAGHYEFDFISQFQAVSGIDYADHSTFDTTFSISAIPESSTCFLLTIGFIGILFHRTRNLRKG